MAQSELGCAHVTVLPASLKDLLALTSMPEYSKGENEQRISSRLDEPNLALKNSTIPAETDVSSRLARLLERDPLGVKADAGNDTPLFTMASTEVDYLADGVLDSYNEADEATKFRLADAIETFKKAEEELFDFISNLQARENC